MSLEKSKIGIEDNVMTSKWKSYLKSKGVECISYPDNLTFQCLDCGQQWFPNLATGGGLKRGSTRCPNKCNY